MMEVFEVRPHGFCSGVKRAISLAQEAVKKDKKLYIVGSLVHNDFVNQKLKERGAIFLNDENFLESVERLDKDALILFGAHGHPIKYDEATKRRGLEIIDATCPFVEINKQRIVDAVNAGSYVFYFGEKDHAEAKAILSISPRIYLISDRESVPTLKKDEKIIGLAQTTMAEENFKEVKEYIETTYPDFQFLNGRCRATFEHQEAVKSAPDDCDLFIIIGSKSSNNSKKLLEVAKISHPNSEAMMIDNVEDIKKSDLKKIKKIALTSGASTPEEIYDDVLRYLKKL